MRRPARPWVRMARDEDGAAMIEFAFLGPLFLITTLAVFDVSWMFSQNMALDSATRSVSRAIRTGQIFLAENPEAEFRRRMCDEMILLDCGQIVVDIQEAATFSDVVEPTRFTRDSFTSLLDPDAVTPSDQMGMLNFSAGNPDTVMTVRTAVEYRFMTPLLHQLWGDDDGFIQFTVTEIFKNEPFPDGN